MTIRSKKTVFKHKENHIFSQKEMGLKPLEVIIRGEKKYGYIYKPDYSNENVLVDYAQKLFVLEEDIEKIFEKGIEEVEEININNTIREYEEEYCNFNNKKWIFKSLLRSYINKTDLGLWDIQLLVLLNEEIEKLRNNDEDSQILKEWIRDIFENASKKN